MTIHQTRQAETDIIPGHTGSETELNKDQSTFQSNRGFQSTWYRMDGIGTAY